jgi:hypothetical protein
MAIGCMLCMQSAHVPLMIVSCLVAGDRDGYQMFTVDHEDGSLRLDLAHGWADAAPPRPVLPEDQLLCDPLSVS